MSETLPNSGFEHIHPMVPAIEQEGRVPTGDHLDPAPSGVIERSHSEEMGAFNAAEVVDGAAAYSSLAYNGLRARIAERRARKHEARADKLAREEEFLSSLAEKGRRVTQENVNLPKPVQHSNPLDSQAESHRRMSYLRQGLPIPDRPGTVQPERIRFDTPPQTKRERRAAEKFAKQVLTTRDKRRSQARDKNMYGNTGLYSALRTSRVTSEMARRDREDFEAGRIDAFELEERKRARKGMQETNIPPPIRKRARKLDKLGGRMVNRYQETAEQASKSRDEAQKKVAAAAAKAAERRSKQAVARTRIESRQEQQRQAKENRRQRRQELKTSVKNHVISAGKRTEARLQKRWDEKIESRRPSKEDTAQLKHWAEDRWTRKAESRKYPKDN